MAGGPTVSTSPAQVIKTMKIVQTAYIIVAVPT